jgi:lysyl-tRNA synthetase class 1
MLSGLDEAETGEEIQNKIYAIGTESGVENLRDFFKELYEILLGQTQGPRLGSFFKLYGIKETIKLIENKLSS